MVKRSLKVSKQYLEQIRTALIDTGLTQNNLSIRLSLSHSTLSNFFNFGAIEEEKILGMDAVRKHKKKL